MNHRCNFNSHRGFSPVGSAAPNLINRFNGLEARHAIAAQGENR